MCNQITSAELIRAQTLPKQTWPCDLWMVLGITESAHSPLWPCLISSMRCSSVCSVLITSRGEHMVDLIPGQSLRAKTVCLKPSEISLPLWHSCRSSTPLKWLEGAMFVVKTVAETFKCCCSGPTLTCIRSSHVFFLKHLTHQQHLSPVFSCVGCFCIYCASSISGRYWKMTWCTVCRVVF